MWCNKWGRVLQVCKWASCVGDFILILYIDSPYNMPVSPLLNIRVQYWRYDLRPLIERKSPFWPKLSHPLVSWWPTLSLIKPCNPFSWITLLQAKTFSAHIPLLNQTFSKHLGKFKYQLRPKPKVRDEGDHEICMFLVVCKYRTTKILFQLSLYSLSKYKKNRKKTIKMSCGLSVVVNI